MIESGQDAACRVVLPIMSTDPNKSPKTKWVEIEKYIQLGVLLPAATFIGWLIGHLLDLHFHTNWIYLVGLGFGIAAGFVQLFRVALKTGDE
jgi:ATP synthase protein I